MLRSLCRANNLLRISRTLKSEFKPQHRYYSDLPYNTVILFVPHQEAWVVERFGKFYRTLEPGLNILLPIVDKVRYVQSLKEIAVDIPHQSAITLDNVTLQIDGVLYLKIENPYKASYGVENVEYAITQLAQTTMRSELGKISLDTVFKERDDLNGAIVESLNRAARNQWGIQSMRYEIRDIRLPDRVQEAMQMQVEAERKKRAAILESEGVRTADINVAEGKRQAQILASEAVMKEQINHAQGHAEAVIRTAQAQREAIKLISEALHMEKGHDAVSMRLASEYFEAFSKIAKEGNTLILPANITDPASMVAQAVAVFSNVTKAKVPEPVKDG